MENLLSECRVEITPNSLHIHAPDPEVARYLKRSFRWIASWGQRLGKDDVQIFHPGKTRPILIPSCLATSEEEIEESGSYEINETPTPPTAKVKISSYAPSRIAANADFEAILDFIKGKKAEGLIVTVTGMGSDKCLIVNDLQALDRGGGWTAQDWIGLDFKKLWKDSFHMGRVNYYGQLIQSVERDRFLPEFYYHIRRPSGALAEYNSTYHLVENFMGAAGRIAVSKPGDWRIIEDAPDGSEVI